MSGENEWVRIRRTFDAPIDVVWRLWTEAELFSQWYGPRGMSIPVAEMDATVGGKRKICMEMRTPERTMTMWFCGEYREVERPNRLVYTESMCDAEGNVVSSQSVGMPEGHPEVTEVIVSLEERDGQTHMSMVHIGVPAGTPGEGGWMQAIDKMAELATELA